MEHQDLKFDPDRLGRLWDEISVGDRMGDHNGQFVEITETMVREFALLTGDLNPIHVDPAFARRTVHRQPIAHGALLFSILIGRYHENGFTYGTTIALMETNVRYVGRGYFGDRVYAEFEVVGKEENPAPKRGLVHYKSWLRNRETGETLIDSDFTALIKRKPGGGGSSDKQA